MNTMHTERASQIRPSAYPTEHAPYNDPTWPPFSTTRTNGIVWTEGLLAGARAASGDAVRFMAGLK